VKQPLHILIAERTREAGIREMLPPRRRVHLATNEQECLDLAFAGSADAMIVDLDQREFGQPEFLRRVRFVSRDAFPILGIFHRSHGRADRWAGCGLADTIAREDLDAARLDRVVRHWVRYRRMRRRLCDADRRALAWWKNLVDALDEVRRRLESGADSLDAYLGLLESADADLADLRRKHVTGARQQVAELNRISADLDIAARTIQLRGYERSTREARCRKPAIRPEDWLATEPEDALAEHTVDRPPHERDSEWGNERYGT